MDILAVASALAIITTSVFIHEMGHAVAAIILKVPINGIHIGFPLPPEMELEIKFKPFGINRKINLKPWAQKKIMLGKIPLFLQPWLIGGGLDIDPKVFDDLSYIKKALIALMGPIATLTLSIGSAIFFLGFHEGTQMISNIAIVSSQNFSNLVSGNSTLEADYLIGPLGLIILLAKYIQIDFNTGTTLSIIVLNYALFVVNILPIPLLDGGHIVWDPVWMINQTTQKIGKTVSIIFFIIIISLTLLLTVKDILNLITL